MNPAADLDKMPSIATLTINPAIDISTSTERLAPIRKLRCSAMRRDAGGGGINVARVVRRFGSKVSAIYPAGGSTGQLLRRLVDAEGVHSIAVEVAEETREDFTVLEAASGSQYRFVLPGPLLAEREWRACLDALETIEELPRFVVASGSLPPGVPEDFYARVAQFIKARGSKLILDTSGKPLAVALEAGVYLVKPNLREFQELANGPLVDQGSWIAAGRKLIETGRTNAVALTLGGNGALLVTRDLAVRAVVPNVNTVSAVGAGDSFVGGMTWKLAAGGDLIDAFQYGIAAGSAAVLNPGTELCHAPDVMRLHQRIELIHL